MDFQLIYKIIHECIYFQVFKDATLYICKLSKMKSRYFSCITIFDILQINPEYVQFVVIFLNISIYIAPKISKELINCGVFDLIYRLSEIKDNQESMIFKFLGNISIYWFIDSFDFNR